MKNIILVTAFLLGLSYQAWGQEFSDIYGADESSSGYRNDRQESLTNDIKKYSAIRRTGYSNGEATGSDASAADFREHNMYLRNGKK